MPNEIELYPEMPALNFLSSHIFDRLGTRPNKRQLRFLNIGTSAARQTSYLTPMTFMTLPLINSLGLVEQTRRELPVEQSLRFRYSVREQAFSEAMYLLRKWAYSSLSAAKNRTRSGTKVARQWSTSLLESPYD